MITLAKEDYMQVCERLRKNGVTETFDCAALAFFHEVSSSACQLLSPLLSLSLPLSMTLLFDRMLW